ncbi:MAG: type II secretion system F family protein [Actinomycetia bacterium]|nr:type II secretion system F family protein [Actinomycetes bacterium]
MPLYVLIAALAVSASIPILWWSLASDRRSIATLETTEGAYGRSADAHRLVLEEGAGDRIIRPALRSVAGTVTRVTPVGWVSSLRRHLMLGGHHGDTHALERAVVLKFVLGAIGGLVAWILFPDLSGLQHLAVIILFAGVGFFLPDGFYARRGRERQEQIQIEMPDTLDQITMSVEAGLGFEAALARAAQTGDGPLAAELNRTLREIQLGIPRDQALRNLADRTDVPDLDSFVLAVVQSEKYGIGIGQVLRVQAAEVRDKRRERAEERALKIPVLILFPLVLCIFPTMFIVLLGPAAIQIAGLLGSL